ncbi:hypothetical protein YH65_10240 [Sulfurovum lithotrophicum]|uniref:Uncharacterized protein n=2 Tax=Sulfurovum lithotrophicum TaxID=206403 RepID=A0A7U4M2N6_9BACT|nr:hypothetical protein YH65_10240 [Sulfurovum lithotrophicum]
MWYEDNNLGQAGYFPPDAKEKFIDPQTWKASRKKMDVYLVRANALYIRKNGLTDYFLKNKMLKVLKDSKIKLALNVRGATLTQTSRKREKIRTKEIKLIEKLESMGIHIDSINFQSALSKSVKFTSHKDKVYAYPMKQRIKDIVSYIKTVHQKYPHIKFGLIDALPAKGYPYRKAYKYLVESMQKAHLTLHHIILDLPNDFIEKHHKGVTWKQVIDVEKYVHNDLHLKYGKIFHDAKAGKTSDRLFFTKVMQMATRYKKEGGDPDYCLLMSWYPHPSRTIPETEKYTQMYLFLKLSERMQNH